MTLGIFFRKVFVSTVLFLFAFSASLHSSGSSAHCRASYSISNTSAVSHTTTEISVFVDNPGDSILGFRIWLSLDRPDSVIAFAQTGPKFDTVGTMTSGWEGIGTTSFTGTGSDLQITGIANLPPGGITPGIGPQSGGTLIKILVDVKEINDPFADSTVGIIINPSSPEHLEIVLNDFSWFPWNEEQFLDTMGWVCGEWIIDTTINPPDTIGCTNWIETAEPPWDDFVEFVNTRFVLDTTELCLSYGSINVLPPFPYLCGDANSDSTAGNLLDLNFLVNRVFRSGPESVPPEASDVNCDGANGNILDLNFMVNRVFRGGPLPCSDPEC